MKKLILIFAGALLFFTGCTQKETLKGNWDTQALIKDGVYQSIVVSNISFNGVGTTYNVNGMSGVNLFHGTVTIKNKKIIHEEFGVTQRLGEPEEEEFERLFLEVLNNAEGYELKDDVLTIKAPSKNMELQFRRNK